MDETSQPKAVVSVTEDGLSVLVDCTVTEQNLDELVDSILSQTAALKLACAPSRDELLAWVGKQVSEHGLVLKQALLARGTPSVPPVDGGIEWAGNFFDHGFVIDETTGAIDYRRRAAQRSVRQGQLLAKISLPVPGMDGQDVFGRRIRAMQAKAALVRTGENVTRDGLEGSIYAAAEGRIRWVDETLSVDEVFYVEGSVGLETGNVDHPGAVEISEDVLEDARIVAKGDVEVRQVVEHADIETGGSLTVRGGITGGPTHKIVAGGAVHARFILDANIESGQDVAIEREIMHSSVKTRGAVIMPKGRLVGGEAIALRGGVVGQISSGAAVPTTFVAGEDFGLPEMLEPTQAALAKLTAESSELETQIKKVRGRVETLSLGTLTKLEQMQKQLERNKTQMESLSGQMEQIRAASEAQARFAVEVRGMIYPESIFCMGGERLRVQKEIPGPVRVCLLGGRIQIIALEKR